MTDRERTITKLKILRTWCAVNPDHGKGLCVEDCRSAVEWLDDVLALLKAEESVYVEERLVLDKLHAIQDYARVNNVHWMADGAAFAETVMYMLRREINQLRKAREPRVMSAADVSACPNGTVLWVEERQGVTWNMFPLEIETSSTHPDTGTDYLFFITYHDIRKFECSEYNQTWRCWTSRPSNELRDATPWERE